jgi:sulfate adenylyltransferase
VLIIPSPAEFDDVELVLGGALPELSLLIPPGEQALPDRVEIGDQEGTAVAVLQIMTTGAAGAGGTPVTGTVTALRAHESGRFAALRRPAREVAAATPADTLGFATSQPLTAAQVAAIRELAAVGTPILLLALVGTGRPHPLPADALLRTLTEVAAGPGDSGTGITVVAVPLRAHPELAAEADAALVRDVAAAYGITRLRSPERLPASTGRGGGRPPALPVLDRELARTRPGPGARGAVVLFTGLSGSGKSTIARATADALAEDGRRTVTLLDGDVVRRNLSAGLGFDRRDRDRNVTRIGFVAALIAEHGGIALAAPIAPYAATRAVVRRQVAAVGDFVLVHVATPLEVCEARDRKGLYAAARRGEITGFTGIDDPYETPTDADLVLDTSVVAVADAVAAVLDRLRALGHL